MSRAQQATIVARCALRDLGRAGLVLLACFVVLAGYHAVRLGAEEWRATHALPPGRDSVDGHFVSSGAWRVGG